MKRTRRPRKNCEKNAGGKMQEPGKVTRPTVIRRSTRGKTTMGAGHSQVYNLTNDLSPEGNVLKAVSLLNQTQSIQNNQSVKTSGSQTDGRNPDPANSCPVCCSALNPTCIKGCSSSDLLQCSRCPSAQLLCSSCLYPCSSAVCTNTLCPLVSTLLTCEVVTDPKSKVLGCPMFRACPKCYTLIMHESGCKFVICQSCFYEFCFICLQDDCSKDAAKYWSLTCTRQRADRQRFILA